jgi:hypothetical protein
MGHKGPPRVVGQWIRDWAANVVAEYSGVARNALTIQSLAEKTRLPTLTATERWAIVLATYKPADKHVAETIAGALLQRNVEALLLQREESLRLVVVSDTRTEAVETLSELRTEYKNAYPRNLQQWCPNYSDVGSAAIMDCGD